MEAVNDESTGIALRIMESSLELRLIGAVSSKLEWNVSAISRQVEKLTISESHKRGGVRK